MSKTKINLKNEGLVKATLDEVQKRASARTVSVNDVLQLKKDLIAKLVKHNVPKKYWKGCDVVFHEYVNCNSYSNKGSYTADSTCVVITCTGRDFFLTSCYRISLPTSRGNNYDYSFHFTKEAAEAGMKKTLDKSLVTIR